MNYVEKTEEDESCGRVEKRGRYKNMVADFGGKNMNGIQKIGCKIGVWL